MTRENLIKKLEAIAEASAKEGYRYTTVVTDWEKYGKNRTYFKIIETRDYTTHHKEKTYGYIDNVSGNYIPEKNNLEHNYTFGGRSF